MYTNAYDIHTCKRSYHTLTYHTIRAVHIAHERTRTRKRTRTPRAQYDRQRQRPAVAAT